MKNYRTIAFATGSFLVSASALVGACSSDDTVVIAPIPDASADADARPPFDSGPDPDPDTGTRPDTGIDSGPFDAGLKPQSYADTVATAICSALTRCCFGNANVPDGGAVDGGTFDHEECLNVYKALGFEFSSEGYDEVDAGNVQLDQTLGADCLQKIDTLACELTGAAFKQIRTACFGALVGKVTSGQPCQRSIECAKGHYCDPAGTAGPGTPGTCVPLKTQGQNCSISESGNVDNDAIFAEEACSWRGSGDTGLHCDSWDYVGGALDYRDRNEWTCQPNVANESGCSLSAWCADGICKPIDYVCKSPLAYFSEFSCEAHVNP